MALMPVESRREFKYDDLPSQHFRLFKLDLASSPEQLKGCILSCYLSGQLDFFNKGMWKDLFGDTMEIMKITSGDSGYDAVSYVWGSTDENTSKYTLDLSTIRNSIVEGEVSSDYEPSRNGTISIHKNLHTLLRELLRRKHDHFLWIDAICINQANQSEKGIQIPMMKYVYQSAKRLIIWLETEMELDPIEAAALPSIVQNLQQALDNGQKLDPTIPRPFVLHSLPLPEDRIWGYLGSIMRDPWWLRLWTLQEVVLAPSYDDPKINIMCGKITLNWSNVDEFATAIKKHELREWTIGGSVNNYVGLHAMIEPPKQGYDAIEQIRACRKSLDAAIAIAPLMLSTRDRLSTLPSDHVFGIMGMLSKKILEDLAMDTSMPAHIVFTSFGKCFIRHETRECLLNHTSSVEKLPGLPSWCPNFASPEQTKSLGTRWQGFRETADREEELMYHAGFTITSKWARPKKSFAAARMAVNMFLMDRRSDEDIYNAPHPRRISLIEGTDSICAHGFQVDEVVAYIDFPIAALETEEFCLSPEAMWAWEEKCFQLAPETLAGSEDFLEIYARTLCANNADSERYPRPGFISPRIRDYKLKPDYLNYKAYLQGIKLEYERKTHVPLDESLEPIPKYNSKQLKFYDNAVMKVARGRRFFATKEGRIGFGPSDMQIGDQVCVFFYCPTLYLIRGDNIEKTFVGEAYVDGLMYGEALEMFERGDFKETSWVIC